MLFDLLEPRATVPAVYDEAAVAAEVKTAAGPPVGGAGAERGVNLAARGRGRVNTDVAISIGPTLRRR